MTYEWLLVTVALVAVALERSTALLARVHPPSYFGMSEVIRGFDRDISRLGFILRPAMPFAAGAGAGLLNPDSAAAAGAAAAGLGAALAVWPALVHDHLLPHTAWDRRTEVRVVYVLYVASFVLIGLAGGLLVSRAAGSIELGPIGRWFAATEVPTSTDIVTDLVVMVVGLALLALARQITRRFRGDDL